MKTRLFESKAEERKEPTNHHKGGLLFPFCFQLSLDNKRRSHKQNRCSPSDSISLIFTRSHYSTLLIIGLWLQLRRLQKPALEIFTKHQKQNPINSVRSFQIELETSSCMRSNFAVKSVLRSFLLSIDIGMSFYLFSCIVLEVKLFEFLFQERFCLTKTPLHRLLMAKNRMQNAFAEKYMREKHCNNWDSLPANPSSFSWIYSITNYLHHT